MDDAIRRIKCDNKNQSSVFFNTRELSVNREDLRASTLVGLNWENPLIDSLAVQHLNNQLSKIEFIKCYKRIQTCNH